MRKTSKILHFYYLISGLALWLCAAGNSFAQETFYVHPTNTLNGAPGTDIGSCAAPDNNDLSDVLATTIATDTGNGHTLVVCNSAAAAGVADYTETAFMNLRDAQFLNLTIQGETGTAGDIIIQGTSVATHADVFRIRRDGITIQDLRIQGGTNAIQIYANGPDATVDNVEITSTDNDSILIQGDGATIDNVLIIGSATSNDGIQANAGATNLTIQNSTIRDTQADGIQIVETGATINNVTIEDAGGDGIQLSAGGTNADLDDITVQIDDAVTSTGGDCINVLATGADILTAVLSDCGVRGIDMNVAGAAATIEDITVTDSGNNGIYLQSLTGGTFTDISITDAANDGLSLNNVSGVTFNVSALTDNLISGSGDANGEHGIEIDTGSNNNTFEDFNITGSYDDGISLANADDNDFTRTDVNNTIGTTGSRGIVVNATSTGNTFTNIVVDNASDDCIAILGDDTTITGANSVAGDGATIRNCGAFGITATTNPGTLLSLTSILTEVTVLDDGIFIDNYTGALTLGDVSVTNVDITSPVQGFTISDSVNVQATNLTIDANNQAINALRSSDLEITDFTLSSTVADGIQLNDVDDSRFAGNSAVDRSSTNGVGDAGNDHAITLINNSDGNTFEFLDLIDTEDDGINIATTSINNVFTDIDITNPTYTATEGVYIDATSTGNTFNNISVDDVADDCFETLADNTTITGLGVSVGDGGTFTNCTDMGIVVNVTAGTNLVLNSIRVDSPGDDGLNITGLDALLTNDVLITNIQVTGSADRGMQINTVVDGVFRDLDFRSNSTFGLRLNNSDFNDFDVASLSANIFGATGEGNTTGLEIDNGSDSNTFANLSVVDNSGDGILIDAASSSNTITASQSNDNGGDGIEILGTSASNIIDGNLFLGNTGNGANLGGTGANSFYANCLRNTTNITDGGGGVITYVNAGSGNFWGSFPADGTGFSESNATCPDVGATDDPATDDDICDGANDYTLGGANDTEPMQVCPDHFSPDLTFSKTVLTFSDPINLTSNPKAIPGATVIYTIIAANSISTNLVGAAQAATITDDFSTEIVTNGNLSWNANSMVITSPDAGTSVSLVDTDFATDGDAGEFISEMLTARCGDLNVGEICTLTFNLDVQ